MRVTVLGCGTSAGVPQIGCSCQVCTSKNPRNKRLRCSILIEHRSQKILFDTGPDLRTQCLNHGVADIDALIFTHAHADHLHGLDDVRQINNVIGRPLPTYGHKSVLDRVQDRFPYAFEGGQSQHGGFWRPDVEPKPFEGPFRIGDVDCLPMRQKHGRGESWGFRIDGFAYSTDADGLSDEALEQLKGIDVWLVDALRDKPHPSHAHLEKTLGWIETVNPKQAYLTHMNHEVDYDDWLARTPDHVEPAYDGLMIEL